ncbi:hypothetical protein AsAng_0010610 [Aureispira anguillae]|uniref:Uncharacterized protein n=1 Tax=Aureispira anguillae TaxID=2864201 RepID=A0A915YC38_9BACT|nr:hypothetical protein AsAng_0010610 [Aureispira anguillae]
MFGVFFYNSLLCICLGIRTKNGFKLIERILFRLNLNS